MWLLMMVVLGKLNVVKSMVSVMIEGKIGMYECKFSKMERKEEQLLIYSDRERHCTNNMLCKQILYANQALKRKFEQRNGGQTTSMIQSCLR